MSKRKVDEREEMDVDKEEDVDMVAVAEETNADSEADHYRDYSSLFENEELDQSQQELYLSIFEKAYELAKSGRTEWDGLSMDTKALFVGMMIYKASRFVQNKDLAESEFHWFGVNLASLLRIREAGDGGHQYPRLAAITHGLNGEYFGKFDIEAFEKKINETFQWHTGDHAKYVSPSFALVQSSGMGKTKLMKQFKALMKESKRDVHVVMLLCSEVGGTLPDDFVHHFDGCLQVPRVDKKTEQHQEAREKIINQLEKFVSGEINKVVLLIDEAQLLTRGVDGGLYVSIRWWLRQVRDKHIVAVFSGTLLSLTNYQHVKPPLGWTRDATKSYRNYREEAEKIDRKKNERQTYDPFVTLTTMAMEHAIKKNNDGVFVERNPIVKDALHDVRRCGYFGRPLFASLLRQDERNGVTLKLDLDDAVPAKNGHKALVTNNILYNALLRILLSPEASWVDNRESLASVLATRVQMGVSNYEFAERATSHGYAVLVAFRDGGSASPTKNSYGSASIAFPPDPVCSALAMGLMRESWSLGTVGGNASVISGKSPRFWINAAASMFDHGLFLPNRGDPGEVFAALYMLLCGDELRAQTDSCMRKFGIEFAGWYAALFAKSDAADSSNSIKLGNDTDDNTTARRSPRISKLKADQEMDGCEPWQPGANATKWYLNFIQVCRNYFRTHAWFKQDALEYMYDTASGCYVFSNCPAIDIVFPLRVVENAKERKYHPVLVSVKCWDAIGGGDMKKALDDMKEYLNNYRDTEDKSTTALCLLIVIGAQSTGKLPSPRGSFPCEDAFLPVVVPAEDKFGVNEVIVARATASARAEVLASHPYAHVEDPNYYALRSKALGEDRKFGEELFADKQEIAKQPLVR